MNEFRASNGIQKTQALFYEFQNKDAMYSLREQEFTSRAGKTYQSVYEIYMDSADEYEAAMKIVGNMSHWRKLCGLDWFLNGKVMGHTNNTYQLSGLKQWREDMRARDESVSKGQLITEAEGGNVAAMRYLNESARKKTVGRPEKKVPKVSSAVTSIQDAHRKIK
jgi:hypothetical protein